MALGMNRRLRQRFVATAGASCVAYVHIPVYYLRLPVEHTHVLNELLVNSNF